MKNLLLVGGTMGVGKTTVCKALKNNLDSCVFLDGDWCWDAHPFVVNDETKAMVLDNITYLLNSFLSCSAYKTVIFCWVMHENSIINSIASQIVAKDVNIIPISLVCSEKYLRERLEKDVQAGIRTSDVIERSTKRIPLYNKLSTVKINTDGKDVEKIAGEISDLLKK